MITEQNLDSKFAIFTSNKQKIYVNPDKVTYFYEYIDYTNPKRSYIRIWFGHDHWIAVDETIEEVLKILSE